MTEILTFAFTDGATANGGTGHEIDLQSGLTANQVDVLGVVSDAVVDTPTGWSAAPEDVANAGMYVFRRTSAASGLVLIKTSADVPCAVAHVRFNGVSGVDVAKKQVISGSSDTTTPTATASLSSTGQGVAAFGMLHNFATAPTDPIWSGGLTALDTVAGPAFAVATDGNNGRSCAITAAVALDAGASPVSTAVAYTNAASDRGTLYLSWEAVTPGGITVEDYGAVPPPSEVTLTPAVLTLAAVPINPVPGAVTVALTPAALALAAIAATPTPGAVTVALTPATLALTARALSPAAPNVVPPGVAVRYRRDPPTAYRRPDILTFRR